MYAKGFPKIVSWKLMLKKFYLLFLLALYFLPVAGQDYIERDYFQNARAKNASIAAARYAEEGYYYTKFTTYISAVDSSRLFADTALFFIKRSLMLCDTALLHAPKTNYPAIDFLNSGEKRTGKADSIIREFYPMVDVKSHNVFGNEASLHLSNAVMDFFNASLLLRSEDGSELAKDYEVLPYEDEVLRLEADESAFQAVANEYEAEIDKLILVGIALNEKISSAPDQKSRYKVRNRLGEIEAQLNQSVSRLRDTSTQIEEIREILDDKYLSDVKDVEDPEHVSQFDTKRKAQEIEMDKMVPDGLAYKIQLGYYPANVDIENFHGLFPISGETVKDDLVRIYAGLFFSYSEASKGNKYIKENAIPNAFVVPFNNGKKISMSQAIEIEKARGIK